MARVRPKRSATFATEVRRQFGGVARQWGLADPVEDDSYLSTISFSGDRLTYDWLLDPQDAVVSVSIDLVVTGGVLSAWLEEVVADRRDVRTGARTWLAMQAAIASHVEWLTRLHPVLAGPAAEEFLQRAGARLRTPDLD